MYCIPQHTSTEYCIYGTYYTTHYHYVVVVFCTKDKIVRRKKNITHTIQQPNYTSSSIHYTNVLYALQPYHTPYKYSTSGALVYMHASLRVSKKHTAPSLLSLINGQLRFSCPITIPYFHNSSTAHKIQYNSYASYIQFCFGSSHSFSMFFLLFMQTSGTEVQYAYNCTQNLSP